MLGLLICLTLGQAAVPDSSPVDTVHYGGQNVRYRVKDADVLLLDSAWVRYREMTVHSDSIHYDLNEQRLRAYGEVLFTSGDQNINGVELQYDIDTRKGMMRTARTELQDGFFHAEEVWLVEEKTIHARRGYYTTCDRDHPHYDFFGPRVKLLMDDIVITRPVLLRLFGFPVLAAPFWLVPVANQRQSGLMPFKVGFSNDQGWYGKDLAWYQVINEYADATVYLDVMTRKGIQPRAEAVYIVNPLARGSIQGSWIREWDTRRTRYSFNASHSSVFLFDSELKAEADIVSDSRYVPEYGEDQIDWLKQEASSFIQLTRPIRRVGNFSVLARNRREFLQHRSYSQLPSARLSFGTRPLVAGWNFAPGLGFENVLRNYADSLDADTARSVELDGRASVGFSSPDYRLGSVGGLRLRHDLALSAERQYWNDTLASSPARLGNELRVELDQRLGGGIALRQSISAGQDNRLDTAAFPQTRYSASTGAELALYRVFGIETGNLHGLLHTVRPSAYLTYQPGVTSRRILGTPDLLEPEDVYASYRVDNGFQAKAGSTRSVVDLGRVGLSGSYDLLDRRLSPLRADAALYPLRSVEGLDLQLDAGVSFDLETLRFKDDYSVGGSFSWDALVWRGPVTAADSAAGRLDSDWRVQLRLRHSLTGNSQMLTGSFGFQFPGWRVDLASVGYNFKTAELTDYSVTVWRDLHCWEALATFEKLGASWKYDFEVRIKRLPDVKFGKSTFRTFLPE